MGLECEAERDPMAQLNATGTPYHDMTPRQKGLFIFKVAVCILTFGFVFPNVMSD